MQFENYKIARNVFIFTLESLYLLFDVQYLVSNYCISASTVHVSIHE